MNLAAIALVLLYRAALIGSLMYVVGYLGWSAWWLLLLGTLVSYEWKSGK